MMTLLHNKWNQSFSVLWIILELLFIISEKYYTPDLGYFRCIITASGKSTLLFTGKGDQFLNHLHVMEANS